VALSLNLYLHGVYLALEVLSAEGVSLEAFLDAACAAIDMVPNSLERTSLGRPRYHAESRLVALLIKEWLNKSYRDVEVYMEDNKQTLAEFSLTVPDHNTIWRIMTFLSEPYVKELNQQVTLNLKKGNTSYPLTQRALERRTASAEEHSIVHI
jgi:hypothetical protein